MRSHFSSLVKFSEVKSITFIFIFLFTSSTFYAQQATLKVADNLIVEGIPPLSTELTKDINKYTESRGAAFVGWHPLKKEALILTRFGNSNQVHYVKMPVGERKQLTFFDEPISGASFEPVKGNYFLFFKDNGGDEFSQIYRYDFLTANITLLTDGKRSQNGNVKWNHKGDKISYTSTKRNGKDRDIYLMDPLDMTSDKLIGQNTGGSWRVVDWSNDDSKLLVQEGISINESRLYMMDIKTGTKTRLLPQKDERTTYSGIAFTKDNKGVYITTNKDNEFNSLAVLDLATQKLQFISTAIPWGIEDVELSADGKQMAFTANENGLSKCYILSTATNQYRSVDNLPVGVITGIAWAADSKSLGMTINSYNSSADVYEYNTTNKELIRWTESELGGMDMSTLQAPQLISWKSFDGKVISGYEYKASSKFTGKRPVVISIHGGPEAQARPTFMARNNYLLNELGITIITPNVRGSDGYGKTFLDADNGAKREESVKDIGALIEWIATQPDLDKDRILIMGGSYGGYMTLAVSYLYSDKIRCSVDVVGISNFNTFLKNTESYRRDLRRVEYGDESDPKMSAFFETIAPLNHTDKIKKPLFIVQGGNDPRVPFTEAVQMKDKIKQSGGTVWFLMAKDEGHGFKKKNNVDFQFYATVEFIKMYLLN